MSHESGGRTPKPCGFGFRQPSISVSELCFGCIQGSAWGMLSNISLALAVIHCARINTRELCRYILVWRIALGRFQTGHAPGNDRGKKIALTLQMTNRQAKDEDWQTEVGRGQQNVLPLDAARNEGRFLGTILLGTGPP